ncbi:MAG: aryl-alcohol dehydrogenase-like predicted oxidoreductase [Verrucomicrobiales bacterium]|jgi:aryl-alcohol dehydrogenase-like predicted oxidoreductase
MRATPTPLQKNLRNLRNLRLDTTMKSRTLGNTNYKVSEIGFGAWAIGADWGEVTEEQAHEALNAAFDAGMNFIDTADVYGLGRSEKIIGEVVKSRSETITIATKMGRGSDQWDTGYDQIAKAAENSCKNLGVDALDLVQLHCIPTDTLKAGKVFESLQKVKDAGLIKHYGASVETIDEALFCIRNSSATTLQIIFNIFRQRMITGMLSAAQVNNVGLIARVPLASGLLTGKFSLEHHFTDDDHRNYNANGQVFNVGETFAGVPFTTGIKFAHEVDSILKDECPGATLAQKSLRWILDHGAISTVIPGAKSAQQAKENAAAADLPRISKQAHAKLAALYEEKIDQEVRGAY